MQPWNPGLIKYRSSLHDLLRRVWATGDERARLFVEDLAKEHELQLPNG